MRILGGLELSGLYLDNIPDFLSGVDVLGYTNLSINNISTLKNAPKSRVGLGLAHNKLQSLDELPEMGASAQLDIRFNNINCLRIKQQSLYYCYAYSNPIEYFDCKNTTIHNYFSISAGHLKSLDNAPNVIGTVYIAGPSRFSDEEFKAAFPNAKFSHRYRNV